MNTSDHRIYGTHRIYRLLTLIGVVVAVLFVWTLAQDFEWMTFLFFLMAVVFALVNLQRIFIRVELTPAGLTLHDPIAAPRHVDFRQVVAVSEAGRVVPGVSLVYYPVEESGLVDTENPLSLFLPALEKQAELLAILRREIPD